MRPTFVDSISVPAGGQSLQVLEPGQPRLTANHDEIRLSGNREGLGCRQERHFVAAVPHVAP